MDTEGCNRIGYLFAPNTQKRWLRLSYFRRTLKQAMGVPPGVELSYAGMVSLLLVLAMTQLI